MRKSIAVSEEVWRKIKQLALNSGKTAHSVVECAIADAIAKNELEAEPSKPVTQESEEKEK